jgi:DNA-binding NtrC family response regulator
VGVQAQAVHDILDRRQAALLKRLANLQPSFGDIPQQSEKFFFLHGVPRGQRAEIFQDIPKKFTLSAHNRPAAKAYAQFVCAVKRRSGRRTEEERCIISKLLRSNERNRFEINRKVDFKPVCSAKKALLSAKIFRRSRDENGDLRRRAETKRKEGLGGRTPHACFARNFSVDGRVMSTRRILFLAPARAVTDIYPQLRDAGYEVGIAENLKGASIFVRQSGPGVVFSRPSLPGYKVEDLLAVGADDPDFPPVIVIAEKGGSEEATRYLTLGARDYWLEPLVFEKIVAVAKAPRELAPVSPYSASDVRGAQGTAGGPQIVGRHPAMQRVLALARQVAKSRATVLISGESGTGKEMFARCLHAWSDRADGPFVAVNCAALPEHLLESELFGHEKGAFTGAIARKMGKFELASTGTILLDEISEMDLALQAKLLRVLQENEIDRVGGTETVRVDVRILATTNRDLEEWVKEGKFRQDLFFRLNVIPLRLPPLRERGDDVLDLTRFFIALYIKEYKLAPTALSEEALNWIRGHDWPGNVRELQNLMERAVLLANGRSITPRHFLTDSAEWPLFEEDGETRSPEPPLPAADSQAIAAGPVIPLHEMERIMIMKGLEATSGNRTQAAELLGISVRTLRNKLNEYRETGINIEQPSPNFSPFP